MNKISERAALEFMPATGLEADIERGYGNLGLIPHPDCVNIGCSTT
uniref:Uncharacterized protein n=1 Tax=Candidatus Kentrum sp. LFY TaxID=2126342 RepID=A0A450UAN5_9GAMM|nr:MAG: hypothetical protein BECKLFY1418B_GA0070995_10147 [Candidatus Kentron sp. LFY]